jgi:hypothetical protein
LIAIGKACQAERCLACAFTRIRQIGEDETVDSDITTVRVNYNTQIDSIAASMTAVAIWQFVTRPLTRQQGSAEAVKLA